MEPKTTNMIILLPAKSKKNMYSSRIIKPLFTSSNYEIIMIRILFDDRKNIIGEKKEIYEMKLKVIWSEVRCGLHKCLAEVINFPVHQNLIFGFGIGEWERTDLSIGISSISLFPKTTPTGSSKYQAPSELPNYQIILTMQTNIHSHYPVIQFLNL